MNKVFLKELENQANELITYSKNDLLNKIIDLKDNEKKFIWEGKSHDVYIKGYENIIARLREYNNGLTKLAEFLLLVSKNYGLANQKIDNAYEELLEDFMKITGKLNIDNANEEIE